MDNVSIPSYNQSLTSLNDGVCYSIYVLLVLSVALKFACRLRSGIRLWWDDWLVLAALVPSTAALLLYSILLRNIIGHHIYVLPAGLYALTPFLEGFFVLELIYIACMVLVKFSLLALYWRLFAISARKPIYVVGVVLILWALVGVIFGIFQCSPVSYFWEKLTEQGTCIDPKKYFMGGAIPSIVTDFAVVVLPIPYILRLKVSLGQRLFLAGIFALGGFVSVVSIVRLVLLSEQDLTSPDVTWTLNGVALWSVVEMGLGIVAACLPSLGPLIHYIRKRAPFSLQFSFHRSTNEKTSEPDGAESSGKEFDASVSSEGPVAGTMSKPPDLPVFLDEPASPPKAYRREPGRLVDADEQRLRTPIPLAPKNSLANIEQQRQQQQQRQHRYREKSSLELESRNSPVSSEDSSPAVTPRPTSRRSSIRRQSSIFSSEVGRMIYNDLEAAYDCKTIY